MTVHAGVIERAVSFRSGDGTLRGVLACLPPHRQALQRSHGTRGVVLLHGWGTCRTGPHDMLVKLARELAALGLPALRFDFRGRGESTGRVLDTDLDMMIDDAARAAAFLRDETGVRDVDAVGLCSGANVALAAAACEKAFGRVVALSALPFQSHATRGVGFRRRWMMLAALVAKALHPGTWWRLVTGRVRVGRVAGNLFGGGGSKAANGSRKSRNLKDSRRDVMGALARFEGEVMFVWGGADAEGMGAKRHFEEFARDSSFGADFKVVEGASHNFHSLAWEREVFDAAAAFLRDAPGA